MQRMGRLMFVLVIRQTETRRLPEWLSDIILYILYVRAAMLNIKITTIHTLQKF